MRELLETNNLNDLQKLQKLLKKYKIKHSKKINILMVLLDENN